MPDDIKGIPIKNGDSWVLHSNPFRFLYLTAEKIIKDAADTEARNDNASAVHYSLSAINLLLLSAEALINRVYDEFIFEKFPAAIRDEISDKWSITLKWYFAPLLLKSDGATRTFAVDSEPWQSFSELKKVRDYFAHLKPMLHHLIVLDAQKKTIDYAKGDIPRWPQTKIPKDLNHFRASHAQKVMDIIRQMIDTLDSFIDGLIKKGDWYLIEKMQKG